MDTRSRRLIALNGVLLLALGAVVIAPAVGSSAQPERNRGDYAMVGGDMTGSNTNAIYIIDAVNQELIALKWDESSKSLKYIGMRDLTQDNRVDHGR